MTAPSEASTPAPLAPAAPGARPGLALRAALVGLGWVPAHAALLVAIGWAIGRSPAIIGSLLALAGMVASGCALHACAWRAYDEPVSLTALTTPSPRASRLLWAALLMVPAVGSLVYLASRYRAPDPTTDASTDDTRYASGADL